MIGIIWEGIGCSVALHTVYGAPHVPLEWLWHELTDFKQKLQYRVHVLKGITTGTGFNCAPFRESTINFGWTFGESSTIIFFHN